MLKKYTIHILSVRAIDAETFDLPPEQNAVILCTGYKNKHMDVCLQTNVLTVDFPDVNDKNHPGAFNRDHARKIIDFVHGLSDEVTDIYVCCDDGESRSSAVAAALLRMSGRSDREVWHNPYYVPNPLVYRRLCREYGIFETAISLKIRLAANKRVFARVQKGGKALYERWQIIE